MSDESLRPVSPPSAGRVRPGLCSVTFRALGVAQVVELARAAGLESIEWGADVHARPDDPDGLDRVRRLTEDAGLVVASYGSYFRAEADDASRAEPVALAAAATRLGAHRIRVWAGRIGSADSSADQRADTVTELARACDIAADAGASLALEFHRGTLTDTVDSTLRLLDEVGRDNLSSYWQPPVGADDAATLAGLYEVLPHVSAVHVFSWGASGERHPLAARAVMWQEALTAAQSSRRCTDVLLEFVAGDDPSLLATEALTLRSLLAGGAA